MSGKFDTVTVILVPGGPEVGFIVTFGLPRLVRSVVAHAVLITGIKSSPINPKEIDLFNYDFSILIAIKI